MTLGGLALAVGILVDDATVTIENINCHLESRARTSRPPSWMARGRSSLPASVSLLCICIVFVPMFSLGGVAGFLFLPMAEAVVFAHDRLLRPVAHAGADAWRTYLLRRSASRIDAWHRRPRPPQARNPLARFQRGFEHRFEAVRRGYRGAAAPGAAPPRLVRRRLPGVVVCCRSRSRRFSAAISSRRSMPAQITLHVRAPTGTRIEETARAVSTTSSRRSGRSFRRTRLTSIVDNIGLPISGINMAYSNTGTIGVADGDILVTLKRGQRARPPDYVKQLARAAAAGVPRRDLLVPARRHRQPDPQLRRAGADRRAGRRPRSRGQPRPTPTSCCAKMRHVPGVADARIQQASTTRRSRSTSTASLAERRRPDRDATSPTACRTRWRAASRPRRPSGSTRKNGVSYPIVAQTPQYRVDIARRAARTCRSPAAQSAQIAGRPRDDHAASRSDAVVSHYDVQPVDRHLRHHPGPRSRRAWPPTSRRSSTRPRTTLPKGSTVILRGQVATMNERLQPALIVGLAFAIVLIYLLIVVNFQSWLDPFVIITALPAALAGIVWMLFAHPHDPVGAGADRRDHVHGRGDRQQHSGRQLRARAAGRGQATRSPPRMEAGFTRFRPVLMTALAMIIGMAPMALERRRAERAARPRRDRRPAFCDLRDAAVRARRCSASSIDSIPA